MRKIWIDCDTGTDDAIALFCALKLPNTKVVGISTVAGNTTLDNAFNNTRNILFLLNREDIKVYAGAKKPLKRELITASAVHGTNGLNGVILPPSKAKIETKEAILALKETLEKEKQVDIVAIGPLTNIALLLTKYPEVKQYINSIAIMGGAYKEGNVTPYAEFNIYVDPEAAKIVFSSDVKTIMHGWDVTKTVYLSVEDYMEIMTYKTIKAQFFKELFPTVDKICDVKKDYHKIFNDSNPLLQLLYPQMYEGKYCQIDVEIIDGIYLGKTYCDFKATTKNNLLITQIEQDFFVKKIKESLL